MELMLRLCLDELWLENNWIRLDLLLRMRKRPIGYNLKTSKSNFNMNNIKDTMKSTFLVINCMSISINV